jgi:aminoglycoside phosphotransferase family enzyme/predicted kinase
MENLEEQQKLFAQLEHGGLLASGSEPIERIETHISVVLLAGEFAYKFKKALNLGFLDFSTLEKRRVCCAAEVEINSTLAPGIYLDVLPIYGSVEAPSLEAAGPVLEYAVRMRRFDRQRQLDALLACGQLPASRMEELGRRLADFHEHAERAPVGSGFGSPESVLAPMLDNFTTLAERLKPAGARKERLERLEQWTRQRASTLQPLLSARHAGQIRACHGDMHLGNMVLTEQDEIAIFDAIEFNDHFRWIDVASEVAFLTMDLLARGASPMAYRFLSAYLDARDDPSVLDVLAFYQVYRALVRAKVQSILASEPGLDPDRRRAAEIEVERYLDLAEKLSTPDPGFLILMHGISGSGKTWESTRLLEVLGAIRLRTDVFRLQLRARREDRTDVENDYSPEAMAEVYQRLLEHTKHLLTLGYRVVVDGTFLTRERRSAFIAAAREEGLPYAVAVCEVDLSTAEERIRNRERTAEDASEATVMVARQQWSQREPPAADENPIMMATGEGNPTDQEIRENVMNALQRT